MRKLPTARDLTGGVRAPAGTPALAPLARGR
jgi:hypothetical protein